MRWPNEGRLVLVGNVSDLSSSHHSFVGVGLRDYQACSVWSVMNKEYMSQLLLCVLVIIFAFIIVLTNLGSYSG